MTKRNAIFIWIIAAIFQLGYLGKMIWDKNQIFYYGKQYKFKCALRDPANPIVGRYLELNYDQICGEYKVALDENKIPKYAIFNTNDSGYAKLISLDFMPPEKSTNYIKLEYVYQGYLNGRLGNIWCFRPPLERYYLPEDLAPDAEKVFRETIINSNVEVYTLARIWKGDFVIEDVLIGNCSIKDLARSHYKTK